jgi:7-carboxy-7-deazaguanine synthase
MTNTQPPEKRVRADSLSVHSIFYTIQGEGPFCGTPAVFVRLAGCNLQCPACDTDYTSGRKDMLPAEVVHHVQRAADGWDIPDPNLSMDPEPVDIKRFRGLVVITGGEPFRQDLNELIRLLIEADCYVQIETNGTYEPPSCASTYSNRDPHNQRGLYIVVSPKAGKVHPRTAQLACCFKYVMGYDSVDPDDGLPIFALDHPASPKVARPPEHWHRTVYLQPRDDQNVVHNRKNLQACIQSCMKHGYTLQLQVHKIIGME